MLLIYLKGTKSGGQASTRVTWTELILYRDQKDVDGEGGLGDEGGDVPAGDGDEEGEVELGTDQLQPAGGQHQGHRAVCHSNEEG